MRNLIAEKGPKPRINAAISTSNAMLMPIMIDKNSNEANGKGSSIIKPFRAYTFKMYPSSTRIPMNIEVRIRNVTERPERPICRDKVVTRLIVMFRMMMSKANHKASNEAYLNFLDASWSLTTAQYLVRVEAKKNIIPRYLMYPALVEAILWSTLKTLCRNEVKSFMGKVTNKTRREIITPKNNWSSSLAKDSFF